MADRHSCAGDPESVQELLPAVSARQKLLGFKGCDLRSVFGADLIVFSGFL